MAVQPGWYPAGVSGRERWWDGLQWTAYEREVAAPVVPQTPPVQQTPSTPQPTPQTPAIPQAPAAQHPQFAAPGTPSATPGAPFAAAPQFAPAPQPTIHPQSAAAQVITPPMGWYAFPPAGQPRWWNGVDWTAYNLKNGRPRADAYAVEPPSMGWVLGGMFALIGLMNLLMGLLNPGMGALSIVWFAVSVVWFIGAGRDHARRCFSRVVDDANAVTANGVERPASRDHAHRVPCPRRCHRDQSADRTRAHYCCPDLSCFHVCLELRRVATRYALYEGSIRSTCRSMASSTSCPAP